MVMTVPPSSASSSIVSTAMIMSEEVWGVELDPESNDDREREGRNDCVWDDAAERHCPDRELQDLHPEPDVVDLAGHEGTSHGAGEPGLEDHEGEGVDAEEQREQVPGQGEEVPLREEPAAKRQCGEQEAEVSNVSDHRREQALGEAAGSSRS